MICSTTVNIPYPFFLREKGRSDLYFPSFLCSQLTDQVLLPCSWVNFAQEVFCPVSWPCTDVLDSLGWLKWHETSTLRQNFSFSLDLRNGVKTSGSYSDTLLECRCLNPWAESHWRYLGKANLLVSGLNVTMHDVCPHGGTCRGQKVEKKLKPLYKAAEVSWEISGQLPTLATRLSSVERS